MSHVTYSLRSGDSRVSGWTSEVFSLACTTIVFALAVELSNKCRTFKSAIDLKEDITFCSYSNKVLPENDVDRH